MFYRHEYAGFSKVLTRESRALGPGEHHIKFVIQDARDLGLDSALFIKEASLTYFPLAQGDYNGDGTVNAADYVVWRNSKQEQQTNPDFDPSFRDGDGNGDGVVDNEDYGIWHDNYGETGNRDWRADFNRDGVVNGFDIGFFLQWINEGITQCASRWEGDTNADGAVNGADIAIVIEEATGGGGGGAAMMGGGSEALQALQAAAEGPVATDFLTQLSQQFDALAEQAEQAITVVTAPLAKSLIPADPDVNGNGVLDDEDIALLDAIILGE